MEMIPSPPKRALQSGKKVFAYFGEWAYWSRQYPLPDSGTAGYDLSFLTHDDGSGVTIAEQITHLMYAFVFPNQDYEEWARTIQAGFGSQGDAGGGPPVPLYGTLGDAITPGGFYDSTTDSIQVRVVKHEEGGGGGSTTEYRFPQNTISILYGLNSTITFNAGVPDGIVEGTIIRAYDQDMNFAMEATATAAPVGSTVTIDQPLHGGWYNNFDIIQPGGGSPVISHRIKFSDSIDHVGLIQPGAVLDLDPGSGGGTLTLGAKIDSTTFESDEEDERGYVDFTISTPGQGEDRGSWSVDTAYRAGDVVTRNGILYAALCDNTGQDPEWLDAESGIAGKYVAGSYFDPSGPNLPTGMPAKPGNGYNQVKFSVGTFTHGSVQSLIESGHAGPGIVWKQGENEFYVSFTWSHWWENNEFTPQDRCRRVYWRRLIPRGALAFHETEIFAMHMRDMATVRAANPNMKVVFSIGGWTLSHFMSVVAADATARATFVQSCVDTCKEYGLDGVDIDWEFPGQTGPPYNVVNNIWPDEPGYADMLAAQTTDPSTDTTDKDNLETLMQELRQAFDQAEGDVGRYLELSGALGCNPSVLYAYQNVHQYMDYVLLMTYDFSGAWSSELGHHSGMYQVPDYGEPDWNVTAAVNRMMGDYSVPAGKLCVGLPFYGRGWSNVSRSDVNSIKGTGSGGAPTLTEGGEAGNSDWADIVKAILNNDLVRVWDDDAKVPFAYNLSSGTLWTFDDTTSVKLKCEYVLSQGLAGVLFWDLPGDSKTYPASQIVPGGNQYSLLDTIVDTLSGATPQPVDEKFLKRFVLDRTTVLASGSYEVGQDRTVWLLPFNDSTIDTVVLTPEFGELAGMVLHADSQGTQIHVAGDYSAGQVVAGRSYNMLLELTRPFLKDQQGVAVLGGRLALQKIIAACHNSQRVKLRVSYPGLKGKRSDREVSFDLDAPEPYTRLHGLFGGDVQNVRIFLENETPKPSTVVSVEVVCNFNPRRNR